MAKANDEQFAYRVSDARLLAAGAQDSAATLAVLKIRPGAGWHVDEMFGGKVDPGCNLIPCHSVARRCHWHPQFG
jgi:hypothetical protein